MKSCATCTASAEGEDAVVVVERSKSGEGEEGAVAVAVAVAVAGEGSKLGCADKDDKSDKSEGSVKHGTVRLVILQSRGGGRESLNKLNSFHLQFN